MVDWAQLLTPEAAAPLSVAVAGALLGAGLVFLDLENRANRVFALFLFLISFVRGLRAVRVAGSPAEFAYLVRVENYLSIAIPFVVAYFILAYPRPRTLLGGRRLQLGVVVGAAAAAELAYVLDHGMFSSAAGIGPLGLLGFGLNYLMYGVAAFILAREVARAGLEDQQVSIALVSLAIAIPVANTFPAHVHHPGGSFRVNDELSVLFTLLVFVAMGLVIGAIITMFRNARTHLLQQTALFYSAVVVLPALVYVFTIVLPAGSLAATLATALLVSLTGLLQVSLVGYALFARRLFDIDPRAKLAARSGLIGIMMLAVFLVVTQLVENLAQQRVGKYGILLGAIVAGLVLLALTPLKRLADRLARLGVRHSAKPIGDLTNQERLGAYQDLVAAAWSDGQVTRKERRMLELARTRLGISAEQALTTENEATRA